ncbi:MAG: hypothetical protein PVI28_18410, partial [Gammaproteobacteria bacterium]
MPKLLSGGTESPFKLGGVVKTPLLHPINNWIESFIEKAAGLQTLDHLYRQLPEATGQIGFLRNVLELFNIRYSVNQRDLDAIP